MYKVLLVDDEYMVIAGLKKLIPFHQYDMEVVYGASSATEALSYIAHHPVDVIITDVNMPGINGLEMVRQMRKQLPHAAYIILSGYKEFEYVKTALNLQVADYLVKPVDKVELGQSLSQIARTFASKKVAYPLLRADTTEEEFEQMLRTKSSVFLAAAKTEQGEHAVPFTVLGQSVFLFLTEDEGDFLLSRPFHAPYVASFQEFTKELETYFFYGNVALQPNTSAFRYYEPIYRVIIQGNLQQILEELGLLEEIVLKTTPRVSTTKQLFIQFVMDVFHLFEHLKPDDMTQIIKKLESSKTFEGLSQCMRKEITQLFSQHRLNENVANVLELISSHYRQEISLKDIGAQLFINPVYLGQLIKKETNSTFAELLNKQRIKAAQQLLLATNNSIEDICYSVGYSNVGYFYKVFRKLCGKSPKAYRQQV
ncbi:MULTISPECIES: response regulator transcription factor [unclassified Streptococcus]|uniref:response regulator transcription factor n=1 Tax=unclassified Streptococcus TaxID=2608887 RepID=UPI0010724BFD|nr:MULTISPECIES: response regulator transcription factor [unclassified Streptococcus]MBF0787214.1 response regulator transcription factor [Streptococcus sp. 19428wC2_LYSM12]MCQ9211900.1 response regulator transcription factor [Streptococcus sp. B01]TFV05844.1 response regulator transcription factor [Streptococcus sp. LYSM12]